MRKACDNDVSDICGATPLVRALRMGRRYQEWDLPALLRINDQGAEGIMTVIEFWYSCLAEDFIGWIWAFCGDGGHWMFP